MSAFPRSCGASTRALSTVFATMLALLLSALGGIRLGLDRLVGAGDDEVPVVACQSLRSGDHLVAPTARPAIASHPAAAPAQPEPQPLLARCDAPVPGPRLGSAGGPRAP
jgi:hypothetical protein